MLLLLAINSFIKTSKSSKFEVEAEANEDESALAGDSPLSPDPWLDAIDNREGAS